MEATKTVAVRIPAKLYKKYQKRLIDKGISAREDIQKHMESSVYGVIRKGKDPAKAAG